MTAASEETKIIDAGTKSRPSTRKEYYDACHYLSAMKSGNCTKSTDLVLTLNQWAYLVRLAQRTRRVSWVVPSWLRNIVISSGPPPDDNDSLVWDGEYLEMAAAFDKHTRAVYGAGGFLLGAASVVVGLLLLKKKK